MKKKKRQHVPAYTYQVPNEEYKKKIQ